MSEAVKQEIAEFFGRSGSGPLAGLIVADFGRVLAAPYCTMLLADMGATVIKVESPEGDETRSWQPPVYEDEATYYLSINRNKHSISLDLKDPADLQTARLIAEGADILVENFKPGGLSKFGLDYESVSVANPSVLYASITGFGTVGGAELPGYDLLVQAASGLMDLTGSPETEPFRAGVAVFDVITGLHTCIGILAALHHRTLTGVGQRIELNLMSSALSGMVNQTGAYAIAGVVPRRMGNEHPSIYPYEPIITGQGHIVLAIGNDRQFRVLCGALDIPEIAFDIRFMTAPSRSRNRLDLRPHLEKALAARTAAEWFDRLSAVGVPCAPIRDIRGGIEFAGDIGLDPIVQSGRGTDAMPGIRNPIEFSQTRVSYDVAPPRLNADSDLIRAWLGSQGSHASFSAPETAADS